MSTPLTKPVTHKLINKSLVQYLLLVPDFATNDAPTNSAVIVAVASANYVVFSYAEIFPPSRETLKAVDFKVGYGSLDATHIWKVI